MNFSTILLIALAGFVLGMLIVYFLLKATMVKRVVYDDVKNQLVTKTAVETELRTSLLQINQQLENSQNKKSSLENENATFKARLDGLIEKADDQRNLLAASKSEIDLQKSQNLKLNTIVAQLEEQKKALVEKLKNQANDFEIIRQKSLLEFEKTANKLFDEKTTKFSKESKANLENLLHPLKENLKDFKKKVEETYDKESKQRFSLEGKIKELVELNQQISSDATNLTNALKGQSKTQGDWGEMILESILEYSGLIKDRQYFLQASFRDELGKLKQPDVTIKYPDNRHIIIDSKVSLTAYEKFANSDNVNDQKVYLDQHLKSIKNHIDNLSSKAYEELDKALDFVFLFIPIEPAFLTALQHDHQLWNYAYSKRIVLISPTNLIAVLRVISDVWSKEIQNNNAREISKRGERIYDKFVGFVEDMQGIEKHLEKANEKYSDAMKKLSTGKGNLIGQAENLKNLGVNPKKSIPEKLLIDNVEIEDDKIT